MTMTNADSLVQRTSQSKKQVGRSVSINGVHAIDVNLNKSENLNDPVLDLNIKINNPIGRLWLALKRIWKSQNTIINFKLTIPLIVLPIVIYVIYALWQGRGVSTPISKLGIIHTTVISGSQTDLLVIPTSDVYTLMYDSSFDTSHRLVEKPVVVIGTYRHLDNTLHVEDVIAYNPADITPSTNSTQAPRSLWDSILSFIAQFK